MHFFIDFNPFPEIGLEYFCLHCHAFVVLCKWKQVKETNTRWKQLMMSINIYSNWATSLKHWISKVISNFWSTHLSIKILQHYLNRQGNNPLLWTVQGLLTTIIRISSEGVWGTLMIVWMFDNPPAPLMTRAKYTPDFDFPYDDRMP